MGTGGHGNLHRREHPGVLGRERRGAASVERRHVRQVGHGHKVRPSCARSDHAARAEAERPGPILRHLRSQATFNNGVMTLRSFATTPSYNITAFGTIDFNRQDSEILSVDLLETVLMADMVPGLGAVVGKLRPPGAAHIAHRTAHRPQTNFGWPGRMRSRTKCATRSIPPGISSATRSSIGRQMCSKTS